LLELLVTQIATDNLAGLCTSIEDLCRRIAPQELTDNVPIYQVLQSALPARLGSLDTCLGWTSPFLDLLLREIVGNAWRGRGVAWIVNDITIRESGTDDFETEVLSVAIHELAHVLERPSLHSEHKNPENLSFVRLATLTAKVGADFEPSVEEESLHHGDRFQRVALHLCARADAAGVHVAESLVCRNRQYGLTHPAAYRAALGDEAERMFRLSFHDILATPSPERFQKLWASDLARRQSRHL
jgi:hypothetical protein